MERKHIIKRFGGRGHRATVMLECGHVEMADRRYKRLTCFRCEKGRPNDLALFGISQAEFDRWKTEFETTQCSSTS